MMPMPGRYLASMAVRMDGRLYLFDAGEGTQLAWKTCRIGLRGLSVVAVTHLHADHCLGIPGLMMLKAQLDDPEPLTVMGPLGIREFILENHRILDFHLNYPLEFIEWSADAPDWKAYEDDRLRIFWEPLEHTRFCLGYRVEELERPGRFLPDTADGLGIPEGPLRGRLQRGESVTLPSGTVVAPRQVAGPPRRGRHLAYVVDTRPTSAIDRLCQGADLAFIEGMFLPEHAEQARAKGHLTVVEAARAARKAGARRAVLIHISPRYGEEDLDRLERAAREHFQDAVVGRDLQVYSVPLPD